MRKEIFLKIIITISTLIVLTNVYFFVFERSLNQYLDWLINYQGGFVRRGLVGEFFFQIFKITSIRLDFIVLFFIFAFYIFFYKNFYEIIKKIKFNFINLLLIFSPLSFLYPVMEQKVSGRKDVIFLFCLSFLCVYLRKIKFEYQKYLIIFFSFFSLFSHTGFIFFIPFFLIVFILSNKEQTFIFILRELIIICLSILFFLILILNNTVIKDDSIELICNSISQFVRDDCAYQGYISTLTWSLERNIILKNELWIAENYNFYFLKVFIITFFPLLFIFSFTTLIRYKNINVVLICLLLILLSFPLFYIGSDYGRYLHIIYLSFLMIYYTALNNKLIITNTPKIKIFKNLKIKLYVTYFIIFLYGFTFTVPHCCSNKFKFIYSNLFYNIEKLTNK